MDRTARDAAARGRRVAIVSDTTCEIPAALADELGIETAPLAVVTDGVENTTELGIDTEALYRKMAEAEKVGTAAANVEGFVQAYERAAERAPGILCLALAKELSSTMNNARVAAELAEDVEVRVVDSRSAVFAQGALVLEAARRAAEGASLDELEAWASRAAGAARSYFATPSLRILQAIGRVGGGDEAGGAASTGPAPRYALVRIQDGRFVPFDSASDDDEAVEKLIAAAREDGFAGRGELAAFFCHTLNADLTTKLEAAVSAAFPVVRSDRRDNGALTAVLMGGTGGAGFGLLPLGGEASEAEGAGEAAASRS